MFGDTPLVMVESDAALRDAVAQLRKASVLGIDTESDSFHHYQEKVCLVQISDYEADYVIDPLSLDDMSPLGELMADPDKVKIFHGADYDVVSLKRDYGFAFSNLFDTMIASQFLGLPRIGLADLIGQYFGHVIDKRYQRHDWAARPLEYEHLHYARGDTHWLPSLREVLSSKLERSGRLRPVLEECRMMEAREWQGRVHDPADFLRVKGARQLDLDGQRVLRALYAYRDHESASMDRPAFKVIPDTVLLDIARTRPTSLDGVASMMRRGSGLVRRHGTRLAETVLAGLADETPIPDPAARESSHRSSGGAPGGPPMLRGRDAERLLNRLKDWRNEIVGRGSNVAPITIAANGLLKEITRRAPRTLEELAAVPEIREWQLETHGAALVRLVNEVLDQGTSGAGAAGTASDGTKKRRRRRGRRPAGAAAEATE
ncbi:MAG: HRDC domain-containing protein [Pseudomonadota bacterium]|nr:HRDC domain-containing protein [Pseudomonadota bacterium]